MNAAIARSMLAGEPGPVRDAVLVNAAAAIAAYSGWSSAGSPEGLLAALAEGITRAADAVDSGRAAAVLDRWVEVAQSAR